MMALCPSLLTLDLRDCNFDDFFYSNKSLVFPPKLRSVTIVECEGPTCSMIICRMIYLASLFSPSAAMSSWCVKVIQLLQSCCEQCEYKSTHCASVSGLLKNISK